jgi:hypothetical protein
VAAAAAFAGAGGSLEAMIVAVVRFSLPKAITLEEATAAYEASAPNYQHVDGLRRKHYLLGDGGRVGGGVYLWESRAQAEALYDAAWSERIAARYGAAPTVEYFESPVTIDAATISVG